MKRILRIAAVIVAALILILALVIYRWTFTPDGRLDPEIAVMLKLMPDPPAPGSIPPAEMRERMEKLTMRLQGRAVSVFQVENRNIPGPGGDIPVRIYRPSESRSLPILIYYHGGGFMMGNPDTYDSLCRKLSNRSGAVVLSVDYRLAPEHPFPAAAEDAYAALVWAAQNDGIVSGDARRIAVAGDSAGGNLAAVTTLMARDREGPRVLYQILYYPSTDLSDSDFPSHVRFAEGYMLTYDMMKFFRRQYLPAASDRKLPYASPLLAADHGRLPPALIITAGFDPVRDEGVAYAVKLEEAGVPVRLLHYPGVIHGFLSLPFVRKADRAIDESAAALRNIFGT